MSVDVLCHCGYDPLRLKFHVLYIHPHFFSIPSSIFRLSRVSAGIDRPLEAYTHRTAARRRSLLGPVCAVIITSRLRQLFPAPVLAALHHSSAARSPARTARAPAPSPGYAVSLSVGNAAAIRPLPSDRSVRGRINAHSHRHDLPISDAGPSTGASTAEIERPGTEVWTDRAKGPAYGLACPHSILYRAQPFHYHTSSLRASQSFFGLAYSMPVLSSV
ncbi:hypothetical protein K488DRAFT_86174 [Vararia minispora EC-137]|uniref:Uncharacterized protein n=1 Tax=Vararia minispora EC-137 TaxID=1314806 RepID=A0ACB8QJT0_9AGAM|nr:hypothetical protein K488DRAFT_86174 [Vararia minispora EC-137]